MNRPQLQRLSRRWHRVLGPLIGVQLLFWTLGGVYFSWFDLEDVHGDHERAEVEAPDFIDVRGVVPAESLLVQSKLGAVRDIRFGSFLDRLVVRFYEDEDRVEMYDARTGEKLSPISSDQARMAAEADFAPDAEIIRVRLVTEKRGEYKKGIPAYRVDFDNRKHTHVYVHVNSGLVTARRNSVWRGFDFLWMFHILDFEEREDFNNWLLRVLSVLGLITVLSGYLLWMLTTPRFRPKKRPRRPLGAAQPH